MSEPLRIGIVPSSTRVGRFADKPVEWLLKIAEKRHVNGDVRFEKVDLRDYPMPFFDEPHSPMRGAPKNEAALAWTKKVGELDGFVFVTGEYNHGIPAVLKNALDYVYAEWNRKPASFVGYGNSGGARGIEQLRLTLVELQVAPLRGAVHFSRDEFGGMMFHGKTIADYPHLDAMADAMLDELLWWAKTLRAGRHG